MKLHRKSINPESPVASPKENDSEMIYQPMKLVKEMTITQYENKEFKSLKGVSGLKWIEPDSNFRESIFRNLIYTGQETKVEFLIVVSMYNEDMKNFIDTMQGISENLDYFVRAGIPTEKVCAVVIVDGINAFLETYNKQKRYFKQFFDEKKVKSFFRAENLLECKIPFENEDDEFAHCFMKTHYFGKSEHGLQMIFCVKQKNKRKLNTHLWFFGGFCEMLQPKYVMLLDVGTKPLDKSLFHLYEAMETDKRIAGCCGEITVMNPNFWNMIEMAQLVEYKITHMFDKALESVIGYITVLPGAFSAYRWDALQGDPLWEDYFKSICHPYLMDAFHSNIYLAEDRVLCLALTNKKSCSYLLRYVKNSVAETDVPGKLSNLIAQRRRWINGSWFALIDALRRAGVIYQSDHSFLRKFCFTVQMVYYFINIVFSWFMVGTFFLIFGMIMRRFFDGDQAPSAAAEWLIKAYEVIIIVIIYMSLGVKPRRVEKAFKLISYSYGIFMIFSLIMLLLFILQELNDFGWLLFLALGGIAVFTIISFLNGSAITMAKGAFHFILMSPTYVNIFMIYAICNIHDCTWGNRPDQMNNEEKNRLEEFEEFRTRWVILWSFSNIIFGYYLNIVDEDSIQGSETSKWFIFGVAFSGSAVLIIRFFGALIYLIQEKFFKGKLKLKEKKKNFPQRKSLYKTEEYLQNILDTTQNIHDGDKSAEGLLSFDNLAGENSHENHLMASVSTIKVQRKLYGVSLEELSDATNIYKDDLKMIESGVKIPSAEELEAIKSGLCKISGDMKID
ncbi:unnamed protein product [Blepharisma stoltei]|uniref:chitin synthase n=1 Tax=Blepharisma stoltei TaxID=1481888 RepID=A0AAU9K7A1_9CILI|nr:unnamed protein product [Blepharisma stoltei]